jgi:hypothetical protein
MSFLIVIDVWQTSSGLIILHRNTRERQAHLVRRPRQAPRTSELKTVLKRRQNPKRVKKEANSTPGEIIDLTRSDTPVATEIIDLT